MSETKASDSDIAIALTDLAASETARSPHSFEPIRTIRRILRDLENTGGDRSGQRLVRRLEIERGLFEARVSRLAASDKAHVAMLVVSVDDVPGESLAVTLNSWIRQSCPMVAAALLPANAALAGSLAGWLAVRAEFSNVEVLNSAAPEWSWIQRAQFVLLARPGDVLHPSLAAAIAKAAAAESADIVVWNELVACGTRSRSHRVVGLRRPALERLTLLNFNYISLAFAVRAELLVAYPGDVFAAIAESNGHLFHLWLLTRAGCRWHTHPEYLGHRVAPSYSRLMPGSAVSHQNSAGLLATLAPVLEFRDEPGVGVPYRLVPRCRAKKISVIIPFRNEAARTCRCLRALARQEISGVLEIILVNNQSRPPALAEIEACLASLGSRISARIVDYDHPFNHSRQSNIGAAAATGDVLVFLNNDAEVESPHVLGEAAAWALVPGVATAGARILDWQGRLVCAGVRVRRRGDRSARSPVEESRDASFAEVVRETPINTFAFAAIARQTFERLGPLDEVAFPNGYNDVDYCLRARRAGFTHIYLGHLVVRHVPGTSRGKPDETYQHLTLQLRYPELMRMGLLQLEEEGAGAWHGRLLEKVRRWLDLRLRRRRS